MTERLDFHRLPPGTWAIQGPAPVDSPWKSLRAPLQRRSSTDASEAGAAICAELLKRQGTVGPNGSGQGSPNTEILSLPTETFGSERLTGALLDRLTHHVHILEMNGESFRLNHSRARK